MSEGSRGQALSEAAEMSAAAGDFVSAAAHLRDLAAWQEGELGPAHPELANTLNNLAVVSERVGDLDAAEAAFRRACGITGTAFEPNHPMVATSSRNLREFCEAHGRPYVVSVPIGGASVAATSAASSPPPPAVAPSSRSRSSLLLIGVVGGLVAAAVLVWVVSRTNSAANVSVPATATEVRPRPALEPSVTLPAHAAPKPEPEPSAPPPLAGVPTPSASINLVSAVVCRDFSTTGSEWRCTAIDGSASAGPLVFYTRVQASHPTTVEHRWYRGDALHQRVSLRVAANTGAGYRTFSRNTVGPDRAGAWRVELRDAAGVVIHEQAFVVSP